MKSVYTSQVPVALATVMFLAGCDTSSRQPMSVSPIASPASGNSGQAHLSIGPGGEPVLSWLEATETGATLEYSLLDSDAWSEPRVIARGSNWFVNWADIPSVEHITGDLWAAHWLRQPPGAYHSYDAVFSISVDAGQTWEEPSLLHLDGTETEHGFATLFSIGEGFGAAWLDGRNYIVDGEYEFEDKDGNPVGTSLRFASFGPSGERLESAQLDSLVCDCCQTDVALAAEGPVLAYRDRTPEDRRDIVVLAMRNGEWQPAVELDPDNWVIDGCPINGPAIAAHGEDVIVAWFSGADEIPHVRLARSADGGRSFDTTMSVDTAGSFGYVDVAISEEGDSFVSWLRRDGEGMALVFRRIPETGEHGEVRTITRFDTSRPADFPQMVYSDGRLVFAWTEPGEEGGVRTAIAQ